MFKLIIGVVLAFSIGAACRFFDLPVPSPPTLYGVSLVMAITLGYIFAGKMLTAKPAPADGAPQAANVKILPIAKN